MNIETESIDRLFLELSQFTKARTARELRYEAALKAIIATPHSGDGTDAMRLTLMAKNALKENP